MPDAPYSGTQYDATTGEPLPADWRTPRFEVGGLNMEAVNENIKNFGVDEAMKAVSAAIQFQGQRGYQQALKNGEPAEKAMAKYGPMIFYRTPQALGPAVRALTPPPVFPAPTWRPPTNGAPGYFDLGKGRINVPRPPAATKPTAPLHVGNALYERNPTTGEYIQKIAPPARPEARSISVQIPGETESEKITSHLTPSEFAARQAALPPPKAIQDLLDEYQEHKSKITTGDLRYGLANAYSRENRAKELRAQLARNGFDADTGKRVSAAIVPPAQLKSLAEQSDLSRAKPVVKASGPTEKVRVKGPNGQTGTVPKGTKLPEGWTLE